MRRYARFGLRSFFLTVTILAIAVHYWTTIPQRATVAFADAVLSQNDDALDRLCGKDVFLSNKLLRGDSDIATHRIKYRPRSIGDVFAGRQRVELSFLDADGQAVHTVDAYVIRFRVHSALERTKGFSLHIAQCSFATHQKIDKSKFPLAAPLA